MRTQAVDPSVSREPLPLDATDLATVCVLCSHNCGLRVDVQDGAISAIRPDPSSPITQGYVCNKAFSISHYVKHAQRVTQPLRRRDDGTFVPVTWDAAIAEIASRLDRIRTQFSPRAIGLVGVGGQGNHMDAPWALGFLRGLGSKRWFNAFAQEKTQHCLLDQWMMNASPAAFLHADMENARYLLVLGTNPRISNRGHNPTEGFRAFVEAPGRTLVVVDPRITETTRQAHCHVRVQPGTDAFLLAALAATIVKDKLYDQRFVAEQVAGFDEICAALAEVDVREMAARCGIEESVIVDVANGFAAAEGAAIFFDLGIEQTPFSTVNAWLIRVILALTNNLARRGGNVFQETILPPVVDPSLRHEPERALASGIAAIPALGNFAMFSPTLVPEEILADHPERLRALIVEGANPYLSYSDTQRWREARDQLDLLVVIDPAMTETALAADFVLPVPVGYEKWEFANFPKGYPEIFVQVRPPVVPGPPDALPEPEIYARLAEALDLFGAPPPELDALADGALEPGGMAAWLMTAQQGAAANPRGGTDSSNQVMFWAYRTVGRRLPAPSLAAIWLQCGVNAMLRSTSVLRTLGEPWQGRTPFEVGAELFRRIMAHPEGVEIARVDPERSLEDNLNFDDKRIRVAPEEMLAELRRALATPPHRDPAWPFVLAAGLRTRWTANTIQRDPAWRKGRGPHCALSLSPGDAERLGVQDGDRVELATPRGCVTMPAQVDAKLLDGHVWIPNGFGMVRHPDGVPQIDGVNQNELTDARDRDPITGIPHHRYVPCRITPTGAQ